MTDSKLDLSNLTDEELLKMLEELKVLSNPPDNSVFSITFKLLPDAQIEIITHSDNYHDYYKKTAQLLYQLCNGGFLAQILSALAIEMEQDPKKRQGINRVVNYWTSLDDRPYINSLQLNEQ